MKNYPLNPFINKPINWTKNYLQELNSKIWALKDYSDFFLTDYIETSLDYTVIKTLKITDDIETPIEDIPDTYLIKLESLAFHNYAYNNRQAFLETDEYDDSAVQLLKVITTKINEDEEEVPDQTAIIYVRFIDVGTLIVSNARPEGSIDATGILQYILGIASQSSEMYELTIPEYSGESAPLVNLGLSYPAYGPAHPDRVNWKNFIVRASSFASLYFSSSATQGISFEYQARGGETVGTTVTIPFIFQFLRYCYIGNKSAVTLDNIRNSITIYSQTGPNEIAIATKVFIINQPSNIFILPWLERTQPVMPFTYYGRGVSSDTDYGEEIVVDALCNWDGTKVDSTNTLEYDFIVNNNSIVHEEDEDTKIVLHII